MMINNYGKILYFLSKECMDLLSLRFLVILALKTLLIIQPLSDLMIFYHLNLNVKLLNNIIVDSLIHFFSILA